MDEIRLTKLASCAGCGAKVGAGVLAQLLSDLPVHKDENLLVGFDRSDDAAVYAVSPELALVQTVDFFPPICDDPYTFGAIAAANALSDVYAMGGQPKTALNVLAVPETMEQSVVHAILRGGYDKIYEAGAVIAGGHSILDPEPKYGLSVTGFVHPEKLLKNTGALPGDVLFLTKPLGVGVLTTAAKAELVPPERLQQVYKSMMTLNKYAMEAVSGLKLHACTDVTGFGLLGHLYEMLQGGGVTAVVDPEAVPLLPMATELAQDGILPAGMYRNRHFAEQAVDPGDTPLHLQDLLYDPQTSGGLLLAVAEEDANAAARALGALSTCWGRIGHMESGGGRILLKRGEGR